MLRALTMAVGTDDMTLFYFGEKLGPAQRAHERIYIRHLFHAISVVEVHNIVRIVLFTVSAWRPCFEISHISPHSRTLFIVAF